MSDDRRHMGPAGAGDEDGDGDADAVNWSGAITVALALVGVVLLVAGLWYTKPGAH